MNLALNYFFGEDDMYKNTPTTLESSRMGRLKNIVLYKFAKNRSEADREELSMTCRKAISHKINVNRYVLYRYAILFHVYV